MSPCAATARSLLFEDVSVTFHGGRRYVASLAPNGSGKSTFMRGPHRRGSDCPEGYRRSPQKVWCPQAGTQYEFDAFRVIDTVIMGNKGLLVRSSRSCEVIYSKPEDDRRGRHPPRRASRRHRRRRGRLRGGRSSNAAILLQGLDIPDELHERKMSELQGGQKVRRAARSGALRKPRRPLRSTSPPTTSISIRFTELEELSHSLPTARSSPSRTTATSPPARSASAHCRHRLPDDHHLHRRLRPIMVMQKTQIAQPHRESQNEQRDKKISHSSTSSSRASPPARAARSVNSRKKEVERLQTTELFARSNIQRPALSRTVRHDAPRGGKHRSARVRARPDKSYTQPDGTTEHVIRNFPPPPFCAGDKVVLVGRNGQGKSTNAQGAARQLRTRYEANKTDIDSGEVKWGPTRTQPGSATSPAGPHRIDPQGHDRSRKWLHSFDSQGCEERDISRGCSDRCSSAVRRA